jgi:hypothetical protein
MDMRPGPFSGMLVTKRTLVVVLLGSLVCGGCASCGTSVPCKSEGAPVAKLSETCCDGLVAAVSDFDKTTCKPTAPPDDQVCIRCGDGICEKGKNHCNCPRDCP